MLQAGLSLSGLRPGEPDFGNEGAPAISDVRDEGADLADGVR